MPVDEYSYFHHFPLLDVAVPVAVAQVGDVFKVRFEDDAELHRLGGWLHLTQAGGLTSPTSQAFIEYSPDNVNWTQATASSQLAADGSTTQFVSFPDSLLYLRARTALGGAMPPDHTVRAWLLATHPFVVERIP